MFQFCCSSAKDFIANAGIMNKNNFMKERREKAFANWQFLISKGLKLPRKKKNKVEIKENAPMIIHAPNS